MDFFWLINGCKLSNRFDFDRENLATRSFDLRPSEHDSLGSRACPFLRGGLERWSERSGKTIETLISVRWLKWGIRSISCSYKDMVVSDIKCAKKG